jgi:hypothetical protein
VIAGQTATRAGDASFDLVGRLDDGPDNFLSRERALLGDDADLFASSNDKLATVEDDDDLLGGSTSFQANVGGEEISGFESSFPAIDTSNEVSRTRQCGWRFQRVLCFAQVELLNWRMEEAPHCETIIPTRLH